MSVTSIKRKAHPSSIMDVMSMISSNITEERKQQIMDELFQSIQSQLKTLKKLKQAQTHSVFPEFQTSVIRSNPRFKELLCVRLSFCLWNENSADENDIRFKEYRIGRWVLLKKHVSLVVAFPNIDEKDEEFSTQITCDQAYLNHFEFLSKVAAIKYSLPNPDNWEQEFAHRDGVYFYNKEALDTDKVTEVDVLITSENNYSPYTNQFYPLFSSSSTDDSQEAEDEPSTTVEVVN